MSKKEEIRKLLKAYIAKTQEPILSYTNFRSLVEKYIDRYPGELKELSALKKEIEIHLPSLLEELGEEGIVEVAPLPDGTRQIRYIEYYRDLIENRYKVLQSRPDAPFPSEQSFSLVFPPDLIIPVDVKTEFVKPLEQGLEQPPRILRLFFPDLSKSVLVTTPLLSRVLLEVTLQKIRAYLRNQKNATYLQHKLLPLFRGRERILKDQMINLVTKPDLTLQDLMSPTDFIFQFWSQTSSFLLKELLEKKEKTEDEIDLAIAAYLIGAYAIYFKSKTTKERESETAIKQLSQSFDKRPYAFTFHDLFQLKDSKGFPLVKKIETAALQTFLDEKTTPSDDKSLPELIKVKTIDKKEFYISKQMVAKLLLERSFSLFREVRQKIVEDWYEALQNDEKRTEFKDSALFEEYVTSLVKQLDPLFYSLLNFSLLFLILEQVRPVAMEKEFLESVLDRKGKKIQPFTKIFRLHKEDLLSEAKLKLPFWKTVPILKQIIQFFINLYTPNEKREKKSKKEAKTLDRSAITLGSTEEETVKVEAGTTSVQKAKFREVVESLKARYAGPKADTQKDLKELIEEWNPLLDPKAKANLVEDVNSLVRDFLRKLKIVQRLQAPTAERLEKLADELIAHEALQQIRKKEALRKYLILYMLELLSKVR
ncbi:MAG: hypothetical protein SNJ78_12570 [Spirochaetales bacterium]